jgi:two-component system, sensor histidine kinase YesM
VLGRGSIQRRLFTSFFAVILALIVLFAFLLYAYISRTLTQNVTDAMRAQTDHLSSQTDALLEDVNRLSGKILFSQDLLDLFYSDMFDYKSDSLLKQHRFNALLYAIIGPQFPPYQINLLRLTGEYAGVGKTVLFTRQPPATVAGIPWLTACMGLDGAKLIITTHNDPFGYQRGPVVSLCRAFAPRWGRKNDSLIEIQVMYAQIEELVKRQLSVASGSQVFIFDPTGAVVYPQDAGAEANVYYEAMRASTSPDMLTTKIGEKTQVLTYTRSKLTDWTVVVARSYESLFEPVRRFRTAALLAALGVLLLTLLVTYLIARSLTRPIKQMHQSVAELSLENLPNANLFKIDTNVNELQELNVAFRTMCVRLRESVHETVAARSTAIQARSLALQAQMNPHFLYNMLTTISILAEKGRSAQVGEVCESLSDMMRYSSSGSEHPVTVADELRHAASYAKLMRVRFADELTFTFDVPAELFPVLLPRLTIQPLLENCAKHATTNAPPWQISITGKSEGLTWQITVSDNGAGFTPEALAKLAHQFASTSDAPPAMEFEGMGLMNIHERLVLFYGAKAEFEFGNHAEGGAYVTIGGPTMPAKGGCSGAGNL